jgi:hypothetical protein
VHLPGRHYGQSQGHPQVSACAFYCALLPLDVHTHYCHSTLSLEVDLPLPGANEEERNAFSQKWYTTESCAPPFQDGVSASVSYLEDTRLWLECFFLGWMPLEATFVQEKKEWHLAAAWWAPHLLVVDMFVGHNPAKSGFLLKREVKCWFFFKCVYRLLAKGALKGYARQMSDTVIKVHATGQEVVAKA